MDIHVIVTHLLLFLGLFAFESSMYVMGLSYGNNDKKLLSKISYDANQRDKRKAVIGRRFRWTNNTIPFKLQEGQFTGRQLHDLQTAMGMYMEETCIKFRLATPADYNMLYFRNGPGCSSQSIGMVGGTQTITLSTDGCRSIGMYLHELGHAAGLLHEHQLPNRDEHIRINWDNVEPTMRQWFDKYSPKEVEYFDIPYDVTSVMHYGTKAFSKDSSDTIITINPADREKVGEVFWKLLSYTDVKALNLMYSCSDQCRSDLPCPEEGFLDKECQCVTPKSYFEKHCHNKYENEKICNRFQSIRLCDFTPEWMSENCRKACGRCPNFGV